MRLGETLAGQDARHACCFFFLLNCFFLASTSLLERFQLGSVPENKHRHRPPHGHAQCDDAATGAAMGDVRHKANMSRRRRRPWSRSASSCIICTFFFLFCWNLQHVADPRAQHLRRLLLGWRSLRRDKGAAVCLLFL